MTSPAREKWGFSSQPVHVQVPKYQLRQQDATDEHDSDTSPYTSDVEESLCCCPSLSELLTTCSNCCCCCCRKSSDDKTDKFAKVNYSYLSPEKSVDSIDGVVLHGDRKSLGYNPVLKFPQDSQQFPTHPSLPFKPRQIELQQPQLKFTPGAGTGRVIIPQSDSPFPAPYLQGRGPGMQTPFSEVPIQHQPRAGGFQMERGAGSIQVATAMTQRKKRSSRATGKGSRQNLLTDQGTTVTGIDGATATKAHGGERESESKVTFDAEEEEKLRKRQARGRQMSLPATDILSDGRKRLFSMTGKQTVGGYEGVEDEEGERRKQRYMHRARTVGSSPSQQPALDPEKLRRCQTPDFTIEDTDRLKPHKGKKGLALRKCKTPDTIMMRRGFRGVGERGAKRFSESPETESSSNLTSSPGSKSGGQPEDDVDGEEEEVEGGGKNGAAVTKQHLPVEKVHSLEVGGGGRRKWGSWREKSRKDPGFPQEGPRKSAKIPAHVTSSTSAYLLSSGTAAGDAASCVAGDPLSSVTDENPPYIYFSLYFDIQRRALMVNLIKVENLPPKPPNQGSCDPFVMLFLLPNKQEVLQSVVKQRTLNPEFQQVFEFGGILANDLKNQVLVFRIFDHDRFSKNDLIGTVIMPLKDADLYGMLMRRPVDQRKGLLKQFSAGDLLFSLTYSEERKVINGIILKATNLRKADIWGLADPYVKIYMIHENKRMNKWKTEVKKNTLVPIYNESFQFDVSGLDIRNVSLEIWVMDYDWFSRNDKMGVVYVGANSLQEVGRNHWYEIMSAPEHQTSHWHTIIPYTDLKQVLPLAKQQLQQQMELQIKQHQQQEPQRQQQQREHKQQQHRRQRQKRVRYLQPPPNPAQQQQTLPSNDTTRRGGILESHGGTSDKRAAPTI